MNPVADRYDALHLQCALLAEIAPPIHRQVIGGEIDRLIAALRAEDAAQLAADRPDNSG